MITSDRIKDGCVTLWEKHEEGPRQVKLAVADATHALQADPGRWSLDAPEPDEPEVKRGRRARQTEGDE